MSLMCLCAVLAGSSLLSPTVRWSQRSTEGGKVLAVNPEDLSSIPGIPSPHSRMKEPTYINCLLTPHAPCGTRTPKQTLCAHTQEK